MQAISAKNHPHRPRKRFGQHFLQDPQAIARILEAIRPKPGEHLVEIGPGRGAITLELLRRAGSLDAIELDRDLVEPLRQRCAGLGELRLQQADALRVELCALVPSGERLRLIGNLPYNISTPLLFRFLEQRACIQDMHLLLQREVVERIAAQPGTKTYGRLSVMVQTDCQVEKLFSIPAEAFSPPPKVDSAFLRLRPWDPPRYSLKDREIYSKLVAQAFAHRRKTLRNALRGWVNEAQLLRAGIQGEQRAEEIDISHFIALANEIAAAG